MSTPSLILRRYLESGLQAQARGDIPAAANAYRAALDIAPEHPDALNLMGTALLQLDHAAEAVDHLRRAARKMKNHAGVHGNLGQACLAAGEYEEGREAFRKASRIEPGNVYYHVGTATALALQGRFDEAVALLRSQARRFPAEPLVWFNLGNALRDGGWPEEAIECFAKTLELNPRHLDARNNLAGVLHGLERFAEAEREYRACIAAATQYPLPRRNLASLLTDLGRFSEAEAELRDLLALEPNLHDARKWLGSVLSHQGRMREAMACFQAAAEGAPHDAGAAIAYAGALMEHRRVSEGLRWFRKGLGLDDAARRQAALCFALLAEGRTKEAWMLNGNRAAAVRMRQKAPDLKLARTLPEPLAHAHVCVLREQGLGDEIFFLRYARQLHERGAKITYRTNARLRSMLTRAGFLDAVLEESEPLPACEATLLLGDLPHALDRSVAEALPETSPFNGAPPITEAAYRTSIFFPPLPPSIVLTPLADRLTEMRERLSRAGPPPYLGVTWRAGTPPREQKGADWVLHKEVPLPPLAAALRDYPGTIVALQRRPESGELDTLSSHLEREVDDLTAVNDDLEGMLALLALLDDYAGVSNTNMHLRAAVGRTARVLVPRPSEWRWMRIGRTSPWFPGFTVYRQSLDGDWDAALAELKRDLALPA